MWPAEDLSVIDVPFVARAAASAEARGGGEVRRACLAEGECALNGSEHVSLFCAAVGGGLGSGRESGNRRLLLLPESPRGGLWKVGFYGVAYGWPLGVTKHVDEVQVRRDHWLKAAGQD